MTESAPRLALSVLVLRWGSVEKSPHVVTLVNFLAREGFSVVLTTVEAGERPAALSPAIQFMTLGRSGLSGRRKAAKLVSVAREFRKLDRVYRPEILYVIDSWTIPVILLATGGRLRAAAPVVVYHTFDWLEPNLHNRIHQWGERWFCLRADLCVNVDRSRGRLVQTLYRLPAMPFWLPNFPLLEERVPERDEGLRAHLLGAGGRFLIVCPSAAAPGRLHLELLRALSLLPKEYRLVTFAGDGEYFGECSRLVDSSELHRRVTFLEPCPYEELAGYLLCADVGVILNNWKGSSGDWMANSGRLANFLSASVPVVTSDVPNLEALVYKWGLGECCDAYDPDSIARAVRRIAEAPHGIEERRQAVWRAFQSELHFEQRGVILVRELNRLWRERSTGANAKAQRR